MSDKKSKGKKKPTMKSIELNLQEASKAVKNSPYITNVFASDPANSQKKSEQESHQSDGINLWMESTSKPLKDVFVLDAKQFLNEQNELDVDKAFNSNEFLNASAYDFTGVESATDYMFYRIRQCLNAAHKKKNNIRLDRICIRGCKFTTIWSLVYLIGLQDKTVYDLNSHNYMLKDRVAGCDQIDENLVVSLQYGNTPIESGEEAFFKQAKVVIVNEMDKSPSIVELFHRAKLTTNYEKNTNELFRYAKLKYADKILNIFECSELMADVFLSERNVIILTFDASDMESNICKSIVRRILQILNKDLLPAGLMILGLGSMSESALEGVKTSVEKELNNVVANLFKSLDQYSELPVVSVSFQDQRTLSGQINLVEKIKLLKPILNFAAIDVSKTEDTLGVKLSSATQAEIMQQLAVYSQEMNDSLNNLSKSEIVTMKAFKAPPSTVVKLGEAFCVIFNKKTEYHNFLKLIGSMDFISLLTQYNKENMSDYTLNQLSSYVNSENFNCKYMTAQISKGCGLLCQWVVSLYNYARLYSTINPLNQNATSTYTKLSEYMGKNAFFKFAWHMYDDKDYTFEEMDTVNKLVDGEKKPADPFLTIDEYFSIFLNDEQTKPLVRDESFLLHEKIIKSEHARGNFHLYNGKFTTKTNYVITSLTWLAKLLDILTSNGAKKSTFDDKCIMWDINSLRKSILAFYNSKKSEQLIEYLVDTNILLKVDENTLVLSYSLANEYDSNFKSAWPKEWSGKELSMTWTLYSPLPFTAYADLLKSFYDNQVTSQVWKFGFLNNYVPCACLVRYSDSKIRLWLRVFNSNLSITSENPTDYSRTIYMEQYLLIKSLLVKYQVANQYEVNDKNCHAENLPLNDPKSFHAQMKAIDEFDKNYYAELYASVQHFFSKTMTKCQTCGIELSEYKRQHTLYIDLYPVFTSSIVNQTSQIVSDRIDLNTYKIEPKKSLIYNNLIRNFDSSIQHGLNVKMNFKSFDHVTFKLIDKDYFKCEFILDINILSQSNGEQSDLFKLNLSQWNYTRTENSSSRVNVKYAILDYLDSKNTSNNNEPANYRIHSGDAVHIFLQIMDQKTTLVSVKLNETTLIELEAEIYSYVVPSFFLKRKDKADKAEDGRLLMIPFYKKITDGFQSAHKINELIGCRLEAKDRKTPSICAVATINDIDTEKNQVLIHFDGWSDNYDYWCNVNDLDLFPCGFMNYWFRKTGSYSLGTMVRFDPPKNYVGNFVWEEYLQKNDFMAAPFHIFSDEQKRGMTPADIVSSDYTQFSCDANKNIIRKLLSINDFMTKNYLSIWQNITIKSDQITMSKRGLVLTPNSADMAVLKSANGSLFESENLKLHMCCMRSIRVFSNDKQNTSEIVLNLHMMDTGGIVVKCNSLDKNELALILVCSYMMSLENKIPIIPTCKELYPNESTNVDHLNQNLKVYFRRVFNYLSMFFELNDFQPGTQLTVNLAKYQSQTSGESHKYRLEYDFSPASTGPYGLCFYCRMADYEINKGEQSSGVSLTEKVSNKYGPCCRRFGLNKPTDQVLILDSNLTLRYPNIIHFGVLNAQLKVDDSKEMFKNFNCLYELNLDGNQLSQLPSSMSSLGSLRFLKIANNPVVNLAAQTFKKMTYLNELVLDNLELTPLTDNLIALPVGLKVLKLNNYKLDVWPFDLTKCVNSLVELEITGVKWLDVDAYGGNSALITYDNLTNELGKIFDAEKCKTLMDHFDANKNGFLDQQEAIRLNAFVFKKFKRMADLPSAILKLVNLTKLDLSYQAIRHIPDKIEELKNLQVLKLNNCVLLESISAKVGGLKLKEIDLANTLSLKTPPPEIVRRGTSTVITYLRKLLGGSVECKRTKLMLVGLGEAGKTSLVRALKRTYNLPTEVQVTDGIDIDNWIIKLSDGSELTFSMWDFAGQSVYYNTHQFFLTSRAVYLLVWNVRLGSEYAGLEFWLSSISCHAPKAPIFVVGTHIDQVSKYSLDEEILKSRFKQIVGFYFVSSHNLQGIDQLKNDIISTTLKQKYIGEKIPQVWLNFEDNIKKEAETESVISFDRISEIADISGIYNSTETLEAVRFLTDLGSIQYFENNGLKDRVIINSQWIIDAFSKIISIKETSIVDGRLLNSNIPMIWSEYSPSLHDWMLKLTEEFDLTFPVKGKDLSIVPCLLPEKEPKFDWPQIGGMKDTSKNIREYKVLYKFEYLPAGLFNRIQVRLYNYADSSFIWKKGSYLRKNNHIALLSQVKNSPVIQIKVQGIKPENIIFLIHETIEALVNESFTGLMYEYSFPCPDCVESHSADPSMFSSSLLRRATEFKVPFLQCHKFFHVISIKELLSVMPIEGASSLDLHLLYSLNDLARLKNNLKYDITFWFCGKDVPTQQQEAQKCNPLDLIAQIERQNYIVWYTKKPDEVKFEQLTYVIKESKLVVLGISDEFSRDEKCIQVFELVKNIIKKSYILVEFGSVGEHKWMEKTLFASVCTDFRVIMQDPKRYRVKLVETMEVIERQLKDSVVDRRASGGEQMAVKPDVFISYCWSNSLEAVQKGSKNSPGGIGWLDPRSLVKFFKENGVECWIDVQEIGSSNSLFGEITKGMNEASVVVACLSDDYVHSENCKLEFRFAHASLRLPIIKAIVGTGNEWRKNEIGFLGGSYPEVNFQYENPHALNTLLDLVKVALQKSKEQKQKESEKNAASINEETRSTTTTDINTSAFQELFELTERKFLKQLAQFCDKMVTEKPYPRLFCVDLIDTNTLDKIRDKKRTILSQTAIIGRDNETCNDGDESKTVTKSESTKTDEPKYVKCLRPMCEHEEGWHLGESFVVLDELANYASYLARVMNIIKSGNQSSELVIFYIDEGTKLLKEIEQNAVTGKVDLADSYTSLRAFFVDKCQHDLHTLNQTAENLNKLDLELCELKNGKELWLCDKHVKETNAMVVSFSKNVTIVQNDTSENKMIKEIEDIHIDIF